MRYRVSYLMDEIWERAVETALDGQTDRAAARTLTLDGAVKCVQGRLPPPGLLEKFPNLQHLSIANIGVSTLEQFPRLANLQKLILSDNRIAGGLKFLVEAGLDSLRDLDLSNNRIQFIEDLEPLAQLKLVSLDLYECPVTRAKDYRSRVFGLIKSLQYLDKMDSEENERPESEDEEEEEEEDDEEDDPGSGEVDGVDQPYRIVNGHNDGVEGVVDVDEDEESDADEEIETSRQVNGTNHLANGFHVAPVVLEDAGEYEDGDDDEDNESVEEIDEEEGDDDDAVEIHDIDDSDDSDDEEDGVEYNEDDDEDDEEDEEVDNEGDPAEPESTRRFVSTEGEIDGHEQGEDGGVEDDNGETEEEQGIEEDVEYEDDEDGEEEEEDYGSGYLVQPVVQAEEEEEAGGGLDMGPVNEDSDEDEEEEVEDDDEVEVIQPSSSQPSKRKRDKEEDSEEDENDDEDEDEDSVERGKSTKKHR